MRKISSCLIPFLLLAASTSCGKSETKKRDQSPEDTFKSKELEGLWLATKEALGSGELRDLAEDDSKLMRLTGDAYGVVPLPLMSLDLCRDALYTVDGRSLTLHAADERKVSTCDRKQIYVESLSRDVLLTKSETMFGKSIKAIRSTEWKRISTEEGAGLLRTHGVSKKSLPKNFSDIEYEEASIGILHPKFDPIDLPAINPPKVDQPNVRPSGRRADNTYPSLDIFPNDKFKSMGGNSLLYIVKEPRERKTDTTGTYDIYGELNDQESSGECYLYIHTKREGWESYKAAGKSGRFLVRSIIQERAGDEDGDGLRFFTVSLANLFPAYADKLVCKTRLPGDFSIHALETMTGDSLKFVSLNELFKTPSDD